MHIWTAPLNYLIRP
ncbi:MAG: hypothetical protein AB7T01_13140 [Acidithiobacillus sp.]